MKLLKTIKQTIHEAPNRLALRILMWIEKEPSNERLLPGSALQEVPEGELRHKIRAYRNYVRKEKVA